MTEPSRQSAPVPPRKRGTTSLATLVPGTIEPVLRQRGFANAAILTEWAEIAGPDLSRYTAPLEIRWPKRRIEAGEARAPKSAKLEKTEKAVLIVQVESAFALDLQMATARLIEMLNARVGFDCIGSIQVRQGALPVRVPKRHRVAPDAAMLRAIRDGLGDIENERLRDALASLGAEIAMKGATKRAQS